MSRDTIPSLRLHQITKNFSSKRAVDSLSFEVHTGEIVGFVGPNGAGKSTTLNICSGLIKPSKGILELFGKKANLTNIHTYNNKIGVMLSEVVFDRDLTPRQIFENSLSLRSIIKTNTCYDDLAQYFNLDISTRFGNLSYGNKKKVGLIHCLQHDPELIILDEPTNGLDPLIQQKTMELLKKRSQEGAAVLLSSHILSEVQAYCDRIVMIKAGQKIIEDSTASILEKTQKLFRLINPPKQLISDLLQSGVITRHETIGNETLIFTNAHESILNLLHSKKWYDFYLERPSLEETFYSFYL